MATRNTLGSFVLVLSLLLLGGCEEQPPEEEPVTEARAEPEGTPNPLGLPDELSAVLRREMLALEPAVAELGSLIARGRRAEAAETATRIHDSFILKQELSPEQLRALVSSLPEDFVRRDRAFHQKAAAIAAAVEAGDMGMAARLHGELTTACVGCHAAHAAPRFPGLEGVSLPAPPEPEGHGERAAHHH